MPIRGLTRREDVTPRFTRLGKIKKGKMVNDRPKDLTYFRFVGEGARAEKIEAAFSNAYGDEPREIDVLLPYRTADENWQTWKEEWGKSGLIHRCDGEVLVQWLTPDKTYVTDYQQEQNEPCPYYSGDAERTTSRPGCVQVGRLALIIPALLQAGFVGYVTAEIHSKNDLNNLTASLLDAEAKSALNPRGLQGVLFKLRRQQEEIGVRYEKMGKENGRAVKTGEIIKTRSTKWMVRLDPAQEWVLYQLETSRQMALGRHVETPALTLDAEATVITEIDAAELTPIEDDDLQGAKEEKAPEPIGTVDAAMEVLTPGGIRYGDLTVDQLVMVIEAYSKAEAAGGSPSDDQVRSLKAAQVVRDYLSSGYDPDNDDRSDIPF